MATLPLLPVREAFVNATGYQPNPATVWRWSTKGSKGVTLKVWKLGGRSMTTEEAVLDFLERRTASENGEMSEPESIRAVKQELGIS